MPIHREVLEVETAGRGLTNVTRAIEGVVSRSRTSEGLCNVFVQHTSASLVIQENADPAVLRDLANWIADLAPESRPWEHDDEGPDDMPAHARSAITRTSETVPIAGGKLALGTWQGIYLFEHRTSRHVRRLVVTVT